MFSAGEGDRMNVHSGETHWQWSTGPCRTAGEGSSCPGESLEDWVRGAVGREGGCGFGAGFGAGSDGVAQTCRGLAYSPHGCRIMNAAGPGEDHLMP